MRSLTIEKLDIVSPAAAKAKAIAAAPKKKKGFWSFIEAWTADTEEKPEVQPEKDKRLLEARNQLPSGKIESAVSPAFIEGSALFPEWIEAHTIEDEAMTELEVVRGRDEGWFMNIPLSATKASAVALSAESGQLNSALEIEWAATNLLTADETVFLRKGDALKITAVTDGAPQAGQLSVSGKPVGALNGENPFLLYQFDEPGAHPVTLTSPDGQLAGLLQVKVIEARFEDDPILLVGRNRIWNTPGLDPSHLKLECDGAITMEPAGQEGALKRQWILSASKPGNWTIQARLPSGVIVGQSKVEAIKLYHATETAIDHLDLGNQGRMMSLQWALPQAPKRLRMQVRILAGTGLFTDGSITQTLTPGDVDSSGRLGANALQPPGETRALCHQVYVFDGNHFIGSL